MNSLNLISKKNKKRNGIKEAVMPALFMGIIFFTISAFLPLMYRANASILIINKDASGMDAYKEVKSAEFTGKIIQEILHSNAFMEGVASSNEKAGKILTKEKTSEKKIEKWQKSFKISQVANTGVLNLSFYSESKQDSLDILSSITKLLQENGEKFHGNSQIGIKVINSPYFLNDPASPNLLLNTLVGILFGIILVVLFRYLEKNGFGDFLKVSFSKKEKSNIIYFSSDSRQNADEDIENINKLIG